MRRGCLLSAVRLYRCAHLRQFALDYPPPWDLRIDFCANIDYFHQESGRVENAATSMSITRAIRIAAPYPVLALLLVVIATILSVIGNLRTDVRTLVGAVIYILSGLSLAVGIILYISSVNDEMGHRPKTSPDEPQFKYNYGWSFFFAGASFLSSELAAVLGISLYLMRINRVENMVEIIPGLEEKVDLDYLQESLASPRCSTTMIL